MSIQELIQKKKDNTPVYRQDIVSVEASPLWKPVPGIPQSWRHSCLCCGEVLADDTQQYELSDSLFFKYIKEHIHIHF